MHNIKKMQIGIDVLDSNIEECGLNKQSVKIYNGLNLGHYLIFRGYKVYANAQPELYGKLINGKEDKYEEWDEVNTGMKVSEFERTHRKNKLNENLSEQEEFELDKFDYSGFFDKYDFDYIFINEYSRLYYELDRSKYELIYNNQGGQIYKAIR